VALTIRSSISPSSADARAIIFPDRARIQSRRAPLLVNASISFSIAFCSSVGLIAASAMIVLVVTSSSSIRTRSPVAQVPSEGRG
jgi:hypothetical protein